MSSEIFWILEVYWQFLFVRHNSKPKASMGKYVFINGDFIAEEKAAIHFRDLSFQRGYGIFDFFRLQGNTPLFLEDHLNRFYLSAKGMRLPVPYSSQELTILISELIQKNNDPNTGIRLSLTGGLSVDGYNLGQPNFLLSQHTFTSPSEEQRKAGIKLFTYPFQRQLPQIKTIDYLMAIWLQPWRIEKKADDILYYLNNSVTECPRSNFFLVTADNKIITPAENVLKGVTRQKVIDVAKKHFPVEERRLGYEEISAAKEAFITSTTKQLLPVSQIDETVFGTNEIGLHLYKLLKSDFFGES
jgi:branched-chain amino acid aminotransferase